MLPSVYFHTCYLSLLSIGPLIISTNRLSINGQVFFFTINDINIIMYYIFTLNKFRSNCSPKNFANPWPYCGVSYDGIKQYIYLYMYINTHTHTYIYIYINILQNKPVLRSVDCLFTVPFCGIAFIVALYKQAVSTLG